MPTGRVDILLIEDNADEVELALHALHACGAERVHVARDGAAALDFLSCTGTYEQRNPRQVPRLILLDLKLPPVDGLYVLRQIRTNPQTRTIPVVILTSSREERDILRCYEIGVNSYIVKPVNFDEFMQTASTLVRYWLSLNQPPVG